MSQTVLVVLKILCKFLFQYKFDDKDYVRNLLQYYNISHRIEYSMVYQSIDRSMYVVTLTFSLC